MKRDPKKSRRAGQRGSPPARPNDPVVSSGPARRASADVEPRVERKWTPLWLILLLALLFYWAQLYLDSNAAGFDPRVFEPFHSFAEVDNLRPKGGAELVLAKGKALFEVRCAPCHDVTGVGKLGLAPPLAGSEWVNAAGPGLVIRIPSNGLDGPVQVKGQEYNLSMPGIFVTDLPDDDLAALLSYVRQAWGNAAPLVKTEQVKAVREKISTRTTQWRADELKAIPESE